MIRKVDLAVSIHIFYKKMEGKIVIHTKRTKRIDIF